MAELVSQAPNSRQTKYLCRIDYRDFNCLLLQQCHLAAVLDDIKESEEFTGEWWKPTSLETQ